jgi:hypothetical protein
MAEKTTVEIVVNADLEKLKQLSAEAKARKLTWAEIESRLWDGGIIKTQTVGTEEAEAWPRHMA